MRAGTFDVAIREKTFVIWAIKLLHRFLDEQAFFIHRQKKILRDRVMLRRGRPRENIKADTGFRKGFIHLRPVEIHKFFGRFFGFLGGNRDGEAGKETATRSAP